MSRSVTDLHAGGPHSSIRWAPLLTGFVVLFLVMQGLAGALNSVRGEAGLVVAAATVGAALLATRLAFAPTWMESVKALGLGAPRMKGVAVAIALCLLLLCVIPFHLTVRGGAAGFYPNAAWLALGVFAQAGVAEETVFRGFLYGHIRRSHPFWRAALISMAPFAAVHLMLFATMPWPIALAALLLSVVVSFPLARLYDLGGGTVWAPALAHAVVQGGVKLVVIQDPSFPIVWMAAGALLPWLVFVVRSSGGTRS
jgi:membrane protease YdiL (CAAX protease family)